MKKRQERLMLSAEKTSTVISNLFPKSIEDRLLAQAEEKIMQTKSDQKSYMRLQNRKKGLKDHLENDGSETSLTNPTDQAPMADLFVEASVLCAAIDGFAAWSSVSVDDVLPLDYAHCSSTTFIDS